MTHNCQVSSYGNVFFMWKSNMFFPKKPTISMKKAIGSFWGNNCNDKLRKLHIDSCHENTPHNVWSFAWKTNTITHFFSISFSLHSVRPSYESNRMFLWALRDFFINIKSLALIWYLLQQISNIIELIKLCVRWIGVQSWKLTRWLIEIVAIASDRRKENKTKRK